MKEEEEMFELQYMWINSIQVISIGMSALRTILLIRRNRNEFEG